VWAPAPTWGTGRSLPTSLGNVKGLRMCLPPSDEGGARRAEGEKTPSFPFYSHRGRNLAGGRWPPLHSISNAVSDLNVGAAICRPENVYRWRQEAGGRWPPLHSISNAVSDLNVGAAIGRPENRYPWQQGVWGTLGWWEGGTPQPPLAAAPLKGSHFYSPQAL